MTPKLLAEAIKKAVDQVCLQSKRRSVNRPGPRIEEICGFPLRNYPDEVIPLALLPTIDGYKFIGWTPDFIPVEMEQAAVTMQNGKVTHCIQVAINGEEPEYIVAWKPLRRAVLAVNIGPAQPPLNLPPTARKSQKVNLPPDEDEPMSVEVAEAFGRIHKQLIDAFKPKKKGSR